ncbi:glyoxylase-like metal-dependent hydrolase (beta-lactamase superfamily II) [Streptomyces sp. SAI-126]|uniref:MBL fold metallo-hydrolase n=1 Tax=Streptomyces sp. SAI-126 TaxID=3377732 RepID=UPI003C7B6D84
MKVADGVAVLELPMKVMGFDTVIHPTVVWDDEDVVLIDTGLPGSLPYLTEGMDEAGVPLARVDKVVLTHQDLDHIGGLGSVLQAVPGPVEVIAHEDEAPYIQGDRPLLRMSGDGRAAIPTPADEEQRREMLQLMEAAKNMEKVHVDTVVQGGEVLPYCGGITVVHTPGHTPGHICLYLDRTKVLVCGDELEVRDGSLAGPRPGLSADDPMARRSIAELVPYDVDTAICYHGGLWHDDTNQRIQKLAQEGELR